MVGKSPPASNSSPGTLAESPTQSLSEHSQYQKHSNCKERSPWLENTPGHRVLSWRTARAFTFQNWLQMIPHNIKKKKKKLSSGENMRMYFGPTLGTCFRDEVDQCKNTAFYPASRFFFFLFFFAICLTPVCNSLLGRNALEYDECNHSFHFYLRTELIIPALFPVTQADRGVW